MYAEDVNALTISMLIIPVDLLQMLEFNMSVTFPVASFFTVILALVGECLSLYLFGICMDYAT